MSSEELVSEDSVGEPEGNTEGISVGCRDKVGAEVEGACDGWDDGKSVGIVDGKWDGSGDCVGALDTDGVCDGWLDDVGDFEGFADGDWVGCLDDVGWFDGITDGLWDGAGDVEGAEEDWFIIAGADVELMPPDRFG